MNCLACKNFRICIVYRQIEKAQSTTGILNNFTAVLDVVAENCTERRLMDEEE